MKHPYLKLFVVTLILGVSITLVIRYEKQSRNPKKPGGLTVEEIMKKRDEAADRTLKTELANWVIQKKWSDFDAHFNPAKDGMLLSDVVRSLFIKTGMKDMSQGDQEHLLQSLLLSAEAMSGGHSPALLSVLSQIERLPAPEPQTPSFTTLSHWISNHHGPELLRKTALIKLVFQETEPQKNHLQELKKTFFDQPLPGTTFYEWTARIEIMKSPSAAIEVGKFLAANLKRVSPESLPTVLRAFSSHPEELRQETTGLLTSLMKESTPQATEACFIAIERLVRAKAVTKEERTHFGRYLFTLKDDSMIRPLQVKRAELLELIDKP